MTGFWKPAGARHAVRVLTVALLAHLVVCGVVRAEEEEILFEDVIERRNMPPVTDVRIEEDSWKLVVGAKGEIKFRVPSSKVLEVQYADASREFNQGLRRVKQRYFSKAIEESFEPTLKKLDKFRKVGDHPWAKQYCLYYLGLCHLKRGEAKKGDAAKARGYFERLVKEVPDSRFIFEAYMGVGDSYQLDGKYRDAAKAFKDAQKRFDKLSGTPKIPFEQVRAVRKRALMAYLRQAEMLEMAKLFDKAVTMFERVASRARDYPDIRFMALSGAVRCRVSMGSYDQAILKANQLIEQGEREGRTQFLGGAYMALADCYFEKFRVAEQKDKKGGGRKQADPQDLVAARYEYLRVATLYFEDRRVLPKARFRAGRCYERLSTLSRSERETAKELGKRQYRLVAGQFPDSPWAAQAKSRLAALGEPYKPVEDLEDEGVGKPKKAAKKPAMKGPTKAATKPAAKKPTGGRRRKRK